MAVGTSRWGGWLLHGPLGLPVGIGLSQPKVAFSLGLGLGLGEFQCKLGLCPRWNRTGTPNTFTSMLDTISCIRYSELLESSSFRLAYSLNRLDFPCGVVFPSASHKCFPNVQERA